MKVYTSIFHEEVIAEDNIFSKIKRSINNTINKRLENKKSHMSTSKEKEDTNVGMTISKASGSTFDHLYDTEAYCIEGLDNPDSEENISTYVHAGVSKWKGCPDTVNYYYCYGKDLNSYYHLTGNNRYPDDLGIFFMDRSNFDSKFDASGNKNNFRYFSDVVDNNARREIRKDNPHYKNYHSLYGDDWFYSTI